MEGEYFLKIYLGIQLKKSFSSVELAKASNSYFFISQQ